MHSAEFLRPADRMAVVKTFASLYVRHAGVAKHLTQGPLAARSPDWEKQRLNNTLEFWFYA